MKKIKKWFTDVGKVVKFEYLEVKRFLAVNKVLSGVCGILILVFLGLIIRVVQIKKASETALLNSGINQILIDSLNQSNEEINENYAINMDFAKYNLEKTSVNPSLPNYVISANELANLNNFQTKLKRDFSEVQKNALENDNFFVVKNTDKFWRNKVDEYANRSDDWTALYDDEISGINNPCYRNPEDAVFISSDFLLHVYHRLLDKEFEYIENNKMYPVLSKMTDSLLAKAIDDYKQQDDKDNKESYERLIAFLAIPKVILDSAKSELGPSMADQKVDTDENILANLEGMKENIPNESYKMALSELKLVLDNKQVMSSPIFGKYLQNANITEMQDYTQFTPRSHYTKNSVLRSYFRVMMWYGRNNFALVSPELTRDAMNLTMIVKKSGQLQNWEYIYIPTAFLVGKSDDLGIIEYKEILDKLKIADIDDNSVLSIQTEMKNYQGPKIQSSAIAGDGVFTTTKDDLLSKTKGFRLMGQRFTPDGFIFSSLTQGDELADTQTGQKLPSSTTALMVMSIFGNKTADKLTQEWIKNNAADSDKVLNKNIGLLKSQFDKLTQDTWTQNIYWGWLYTLKALNQDDGNKNGYPNFIKNESWNKKSLQTALGSWTELKHDTLLYAKQSYAEMGGGGDECEIKPVVKGYVEPNVEFLDRLLALIKMTTQGLTDRGLIDETITWRNNRLTKEIEFYRTIAVKELQNEIISDDDFEFLRNSPGTLEFILTNISQDEMKEKDSRSALIADVHTDNKKQEILYEADGIPSYIFVAVKDKNGTRLTRGLVYDYYEFTKPTGQRLSDEDWQKINYTLDKSNLPIQPDWIKSLYK